MIDVESRAVDLLNPCKFSENLRQQSYVQGNQTNYTPGQTIQIVLPNNGTVDLSNCYLEFDMSLTNQIAALPLTFTVTATPAPTGGTWSLYFEGYLVGTYNYNATAAQIQAALLSNVTIPTSNTTSNTVLQSYGIYGAGNITVTGGPLASGALSFSIGSYYYNQYLYGMPFTVTNGLTTTTSLVIANTQFYVGPSPLVEKYTPIANKLQVNFNSLTIIDVPFANRLIAAIQQMDGQDNVLGKIYEGAYYENGTSITINSLFRMKLDLSFIDFFKIIHPVQLYNNAQIQINIQLEQPQYCLIQANNTQSYLLQNVKLQYHKLTLHESELMMLKNRIMEPGGLVLPFKSWNTFTGVILSGQANANIIFNPARKHFLGILVLMLGQNYYGTSSNIRKLSTFLRNQIDNYRLRVGDTYFPVDRVNSSATSYALLEPVRTLVEFCEVVKNKRIIDDMELLINYNGNNSGPGVPAANDPTFTSYFSQTDENIHTSSALAILCADIGYSNISSLCNRLALQGIDTGAVPNVVLEMNTMNPLQNCDVNIFSLAQEYLQILPQSFNWIK
jgi:hypothetical protein